jgi:shikimate kinase
MALLEKAEGVTAVYLEVPAETAWRRIDREAKKTGEMPPFLNTPSPEKTHRELHERRAAAYRQKAHIIISAENKTPELIAQEIMKEANLPSRG